MTKQIRSNLLLLLTSLIWGSAFVAQKSGMDYIGPYTFNCLRFIVGTIALVPVIIFLDSLQKKNQGNNTKTEAETSLKRKSTVLGGFCCGLVIFVASTLQQIGLLYTDAGKAGFITALYIVLVPILGLFIRKKPRPIIWFCIVAAVVGLYLLCAPSGKMSLHDFNIGDILIVISAFVFAVHILVVDHFSPKSDGTKLSCIQFIVCGVIAVFPMFILESPDISGIIAGAFPLLYTGIISCGVGYTLQIVAQKHTEPSTASLIMSMESVFAVLAGMIILNEILTQREVLGCIIMFAAIILSQLPEKKKEVTDAQIESS